jgi:hypothetical protein
MQEGKDKISNFIRTDDYASSAPKQGRRDDTGIDSEELSQSDVRTGTRELDLRLGHSQKGNLTHRLN